MPVPISCKRCGKVFNVKPSHVKTRTYCSKECMKEAYTNPVIEKVCESCGKPFEVPGYESRKDARFCSKTCMGIGKSGENHWNYKNGQGWNAESAKKYSHEYYLNNKEKIHQRAFLHKPRSRTGKQVEGGYTFEQWLQLVEDHGHKCYYCKVELTDEEGQRKLTRDHIIPLSRGGSDDITNVVPSCKSCNSSKADKTLEEWKGVTVIERTPEGVT